MNQKNNNLLEEETPLLIKGVSLFRNKAWFAIALTVAFIIFAPLAIIFMSWMTNTKDIWQHLADYLLFDILWNTLWLVLGNAFLTLALGVSLAWVIAFCEFPGRRYFEWGLMLPLAVPAYVLGFVWIGLLDFSGTLPTFFRLHFEGFSIAWFPIRSRAGVIFVMSLALYPYVYLLARNAFMTQGRSMMESAQSLGMNHWRAFWRVTLPMAIPWIGAGLMLVIMETLADFGTVAIFNYDTFTTGIYKTWFGMFSIEAAGQLSSVLVLLVFLLLIYEQNWKGKKGYALSAQQKLSRKRFALSRKKRIVVYAYLLCVMFVAFAIPLWQLFTWTFEVVRADFDMRYFSLVGNTLILAVSASILICFIALLLSYANRRCDHGLTSFLTKIGTMGYALPGAVLAVGVYGSLTKIDYLFISFSKQVFNWQPGMILTGSLFAVLLAYTVRFLRVAYSPTDSAMQRLTPHVEDAARNFGYRGLQLLKKIHAPLMKTGLWTAMLLVFVDVAKEMPITLMTRPFGWDTLAVRIFEMTSEGEWERAALPSVILILVGLIPVILLSQKKESLT